MHCTVKEWVFIIWLKKHTALLMVQMQCRVKDWVFIIWLKKVTTLLMMQMQCTVKDWVFIIWLRNTWLYSWCINAVHSETMGVYNLAKKRTTLLIIQMQCTLHSERLGVYNLARKIKTFSMHEKINYHGLLSVLMMEMQCTMKDGVFIISKKIIIPKHAKSLWFCFCFFFFHLS